MRKNLRKFRVDVELSQEEMADKIGCTRATYSNIERGHRSGRQSFWRDLQKAFGIPDEKVWELMKNDENEA